MVLTEKQIQAAAYRFFNDIMEACWDEAKPEKLCNCVTSNLNTMSNIIPEGEKTQTRKVFNNMVQEYEDFKKSNLLTNCTKKLKL